MFASLLLAMASPQIAHADPAVAWPGFKGAPASLYPTPGAGSSDKHLYSSGQPFPWVTPVVWNYNDANRPSSLTLDQAIAGITAATKQWTDVCAVDIHRGSDTTTIPQNMDGSNPSPGENVLGWGDLTLGTAGKSGVAGITWTSWDDNGTLFDFDMTLSTRYVVSPAQLARVAVHEWGHALGLAHSNLPGAVMSGPDSENNPGVPDTAYNAVSTLTDDDKHGCLCLYGPSDAMASQGFLCGLPSVAAMGSVPLGQTSAPVRVTAINTSQTSALTITAVVAGNAEVLKSGGCTNGTTLAPGQSCSFDLAFRPAGVAGTRATSYIGISTTNGVGTYGFPVTATAADALPPQAIATLSPTLLDFGEVHIGSSSAAATATLANDGGAALSIASITAVGGTTADFVRSGSCAAGSVVAVGQSCTLQVSFAPGATGARSASFSVVTNAGTRALAVAGSGVSGVGQTSTVVEYYNATLDHYFMTATAGDIDALDRGLLAGW
ncbi:MAG: choice-of-anchor D domain-containing protein, partial [Casimicrobiaceae bacterium]